MVATVAIAKVRSVVPVDGVLTTSVVPDEASSLPAAAATAHQRASPSVIDPSAIASSARGVERACEVERVTAAVTEPTAPVTEATAPPAKVLRELMAASRYPARVGVRSPTSVVVPAVSPPA